MSASKVDGFDEEILSPDFFMTWSDSYDFELLTKCWKIRDLKSLLRDDILLTRISPPIYWENKSVDRVALVARHAGYSVLNINEWPCYVHVAIVPSESEITGRIESADLVSFEWAELYPTEKEARQAIQRLRQA